MVIEDEIIFKSLFENFDFNKYLAEKNIANLVGIDLQEYGNPQKKIIKSPFYRVDPKVTEPYAPELDDLCRLHWLLTFRHVTTVLEFGLGKSTIIIDDALNINRMNDLGYVQENLRRSNLFECHSIENNDNWIGEVRSKNNLQSVNYHKAKLTVETFNGRVCTFYDPTPNICPDFIYLDGPDQHSSTGEIRGINTRHKDRMPMSGDILAFEHFLLPGTLILVDGRTANARFLKANLQRDWIYHHDLNTDQHYFELTEVPLGIYNKQQIAYCLGENYYKRVDLHKKIKCNG